MKHLKCLTLELEPLVVQLALSQPPSHGPSGLGGGIFLGSAFFDLLPDARVLEALGGGGAIKGLNAGVFLKLTTVLPFAFLR